MMEFKVASIGSILNDTSTIEYAQEAESCGMSLRRNGVFDMRTFVR